MTDTTNLGLPLPADAELDWGTKWRAQNAKLELVFGTPYAGDPNGHVEGFFLGQPVIDKTNKRIWLCTTVGNTATAVWQALTLAGLGSLATLSTIVGLMGAADIGTLRATAKAAASSGWLLCYGQAISRTTYADLFTAIGTTYGTGDGSTTFNLPDLRGRVIAGQDDMGGSSANRLTGVTGGVNGDTLGAVGGEEAHALLLAENAAHTHLIAGDESEDSDSLDANNEVLANRSNQGNSNSYILRATQVAAATVGVTSSSGSGTAHNNLQPTIILNYEIFTGVA